MNELAEAIAQAAAAEAAAYAAWREAARQLDVLRTQTFRAVLAERERQLCRS